jgi:hypothetical protein
VCIGSYMKPILRFTLSILHSCRPEHSILEWSRTWGPVVIFRSQKGPRAKKCGEHCSTHSVWGTLQHTQCLGNTAAHTVFGEHCTTHSEQVEMVRPQKYQNTFDLCYDITASPSRTFQPFLSAWCRHWNVWSRSFARPPAQQSTVLQLPNNENKHSN